MTTKGTNGRRRGGGVDTNQQIGLQDEPQSPEVGKLMKEWDDLAPMAAQAHATIKAIQVAKDKCMAALPGDDGQKHRYTYIDEETGPDAVQYIVTTVPPGEAKEVSFTREPGRRGQIEKKEAPRGE